MCKRHHSSGLRLREERDRPFCPPNRSARARHRGIARRRGLRPQQGPVPRHVPSEMPADCSRRHSIEGNGAASTASAPSGSAPRGQAMPTGTKLAAMPSPIRVRAIRSASVNVLAVSAAAPLRVASGLTASRNPDHGHPQVMIAQVLTSTGLCPGIQRRGTGRATLTTRSPPSGSSGSGCARDADRLDLSAEEGRASYGKSPHRSSGQDRPYRLGTPEFRRRNPQQSNRNGLRHRWGGVAAGQPGSHASGQPLCGLLRSVPADLACQLRSVFARTSGGSGSIRPIS